MEGTGPPYTPLELAPIQQDTTPALIARQLRDAIATGQFAPGQQLLETTLARSLGVSRGPLREAMQRLTQEGLLISHRNRGRCRNLEFPGISGDHDDKAFGAQPMQTPV